MEKQAVQELIALSEKVHDELKRHRVSTKDSYYEAGFKEGARESLFNVVDMISNRLEELLEDEKEVKE